MQEKSRQRAEEDKQRKLREVFLDLANVFVALRMKFLRLHGEQPPDEPETVRKT